MKKFVMLLIIGAMVLTIGVASLKAVAAPGTAVSNSVASDLRGGVCVNAKTTRCPRGACPSRPVVVLVAGNPSHVIGDEWCGGGNDCGLYWDMLQACCD